MTETIVIYHGGCRDGFCAAWVVNKYLMMQNNAAMHPDTWIKPTYHPGFYGQEPPDCKDKQVIIVDFCYPIDVMQRIFDSAKSVTWLDHHKTAQPVADYLNQYGTSYPDVKFVFDNSRSGAGIAWDYLFGDKERPWLVDYVEDRDLWKKELDNTDTVNAYISSLEFSFKLWDLVNSDGLGNVLLKGSAVERKTEQYVREVCKNVYFRNINQSNIRNENGKYTIASNQYWMQIPVVNICQVDCSEVLHELCIRYNTAAFSMYWFKRADGMYQYGLRSIEDFDVSTVAKLFGGGGHKNAAGFQLNYLLEELK